MQYTRLGHTDCQVSRVCLGTMTWGEQNSEQDAHQQLDHALAHGVNFLDTAEVYPVPPRAETQGRTESYLGSWLRTRQCRNKVIIASKVAGPGEIGAHIRGGPRLNREHIRRAIEDSLRRLQTDYLDLYQLHWPERPTNCFGKLGYEYQDEDDWVPLHESLEVMGELIREGKIRYVGVSNETPWGVMSFLKLSEIHHLPRIVSVQNPYSLLNRSYEVGLAEISHREAVGLLAYSPLAFGVLSGKYLDHARPAGARLTLFERFQRYSNEQAEQATAAYVELARRHGLSPAQMALAYVYSRPFLTSMIIGATSLEQLSENIASAELELSDALLEEIEAMHRRYPYPSP